MESGIWRDRLRNAVAESGRSMRDISLHSGLSPGYVYSILEEGKEPTIERLMRVSDELNVSLFKILYGFEMNGDSVELLRLYATLTPDQRRAFLQMAKATAQEG